MRIYSAAIKLSKLLTVFILSRAGSMLQTEPAIRSAASFHQRLTGRCTPMNLPGKARLLNKKTAVRYLTANKLRIYSFHINLRKIPNKQNCVYRKRINVPNRYRSFPSVPYGFVIVFKLNRQTVSGALIVFSVLILYKVSAFIIDIFLPFFQNSLNGSVVVILIKDAYKRLKIPFGINNRLASRLKAFMPI